MQNSLKQELKILRKAVKRLTLLEYEFRLGQNAYRDNAVQRSMSKAQDKLRQLVTGESDLRYSAWKISPELRARDELRLNKVIAKIYPTKNLIAVQSAKKSEMVKTKKRIDSMIN